MVILPHRRKAFRTVPASGGGGGDPYFSSVTYLVTNEGANGATPSPAVVGGTITYVDSAQLTTALAPSGQSSSLVLDAVAPRDAAYLAAGTGSSFAGDFTIETWVSVSSTVNMNNGRVFDIGANYLGVFLNGNITTAPTISVISTPAGGVLVSALALGAQSLNTFYAVTLSRSGTNLYLFWDGVLISTITGVSATLGRTINGVTIGSYFLGSGNTLVGNFGPFRITNGVCRYTDTHTPATLPLSEA